MKRNVFSQEFASRRLPLAFGVLTACLVGGGIAVAQTKQLKEPAEPVAATSAAEQTDDAAQTPKTADGNFNGSYSIVVESKTGPDGKTIQTKKVWRDGKLVESEEKTLDSDAADATIQLPNGETAPGRVFHFDFNDDVFGDLGADVSPFEGMRRLESQMREHQEQMRAQMEELRRRFGESASNGFVAPQDGEIAAAPSKYWIGATVEPTPELLVAQLPLNEGEGILLQYIVPDSPAAKAGLQRFDVVVKIDGAPIANASDVAKIVDKTGDKTVKVEFFRKGKLTETKLTPAERPQNDVRLVPFGAPNGGSRFQIVRPGLIVAAPETETPKRKPPKKLRKPNKTP
ncbi:MAG: PDZ domain-containing protein, partial [Thermoguttaceae bacterium]|nr:PDZ domain-containing protein [Thermoguttaceae bacterium]